MNDVAPKDRDIAMVFQSYALYPNMTVYENMAFTLKLKKVDYIFDIGQTVSRNRDVNEVNLWKFDKEAHQDVLKEMSYIH